jgi:protocatechuate 3,4-dioxygenase beta subunit
LKKRLLIIGGLVAAVAAVCAWWLWTPEEPATQQREEAAHDEEPTAEQTPFIAGRVVDSTGAPVEEATVELDEGPSVQTDADGRFRLDDLEPGAYQLDARAEGFAEAGPRGMRRVEVVLSEEAGESAVAGLELALHRPAAVHARVVASGRPVADARIGLYYQSSDGLTGPLEPFVVDAVATSDEQGDVELDDIAPGRLRLLVEADDYALTESGELYLEPGETLEDVVVDLDPSATVFGEVVDTDGDPVHARLVLRGGPLSRSRVIENDKDGRYAFRDLAAGTYVVEASAPGFRTELVEGVEAAAGESTPSDIVMERAAGVFGRVVGPDGAGVESSFVWITRPRARPKVLSTDEDGRFEWDEARGDSYTATAVSQHYGSSSRVQIQRGREATLELGEGGAVSGRVIGPDGRPVASFGIGVETIEVDGPRPYRPASVGTHDVNDSAGRFRFESLRPGTYWFRVQTSQYASATSERVVVRPGRESSGVTIRVGDGGRVAGRVTDADSGQPVAGASVVVFEPGSPFPPHQTRTDADGRYALDGVPPGRRSLRVAKKGYLSSVAAGVQVAAGGEASRHVEIRRQKPGERMQFHGIGATLRKTDDGVLVQGVMDGHPASEFGLERGDHIRGVDGESVDGMRLVDVIERIRGQQGVPVELEVERRGQGRMTLEIERGQVVVKRR